jgi:endonuclease/exonuclease/phosphatase family metal-dependent hydrolase
MMAALHAPAQADERRPLRFMTRNLYLGADLQPIFAVTNPNLLPVVAGAAWDQILASNFSARAQRLAGEIAAEMPDLVGLQEVTLYRSGAFLHPDPATHVELDLLAELMSALANQGLSYEAVAVVSAFNGELPSVSSQGFKDIRLTDRDVILVRKDVPTSVMKTSNPRSGVYSPAATLPVPLLGSALPIQRGWTAVDVKTRGKDFTFINTHLEAFGAETGYFHQQLQSLELLNGPANTAKPVVLVGDFNSRAVGTGPASASYQNIANAGFTDAWSEVMPGVVGDTCCHAANLMGPASLTSRIDIIWYRGADMDVTEAEIVGEDVADKTPGGLWPSDHAGVLSTITFGPRS